MVTAGYVETDLGGVLWKGAAVPGIKTVANRKIAVVGFASLP